MRDWRLLFVPFVLLCIGVMLLIGCIPIPATRQFQVNGSRRPEYIVGPNADDPVRIGHTPIVEAVIAISQTRGTNVGSPAIQQWTRSADGKQFAYVFTLRTGTVIWPLCFFSETQQEARWIVLDVDDGGIVIGGHSTDKQPATHEQGFLKWSRELPEETRRRLQDASVLPADFVLQIMSDREQRNRTPASQRGER
jgi:hypothetical protein